MCQLIAFNTQTKSSRKATIGMHILRRILSSSGPPNDSRSTRIWVRESPLAHSFGISLAHSDCYPRVLSRISFVVFRMRSGLLAIPPPESILCTPAVASLHRQLLRSRYRPRAFSSDPSLDIRFFSRNPRGESHICVCTSYFQVIPHPLSLLPVFLQIYS